MDLPMLQGLRACVLSGGMSCRMGRDKSLLTHPQGGCWLTHSIGLCRHLDLPVDVVSSISSHRQLVSTLEGVDCKSDPFPGQGPLAALSAVFGQAKVLALLVLPVDMPCLDSSTLVRLIHAWQEQLLWLWFHMTETSFSLCLLFIPTTVSIVMPCGVSWLLID